MAKKRRSLQDKLRQKRADSFIGREEQLQVFRSNLQVGSDSYEFYNIFNIYGQGGVGKTTLLHRYIDLVKTEGNFYAYTDEGVNSVVDFMNLVVRQLQQQGLEFKEFCERHKKLLQERQKLEADPESPKGWLSFVASTTIKGGMELAKGVLPGSGMLLDNIDRDGIARYGGELIEYLHKKITNKDEIKLVLYPEQVLTPLFIKEITEYTGQNDFYFFMDTYEVVSVLLDPWIRNLIEGGFGDLPEGIVFLIAGRNELDSNNWASLSPLIHKCSLEVFTDEEAREFLRLKKITDQQIVETILSLSQNLPVLLVTLSEAAPTSSTEVTDPNDTAVERFLKWIKDPLKKDLALFAALPRKLNQDIIEVIIEDAVDSTALFQWLCNRPFVQKRGGHWAYHPIVRNMMIKYLSQKSVRQWKILQDRLVNYYQKLVGSSSNWESDNWRANKIELQFHQLCSSPDKQKKAVQDFVRVYRELGEEATIPLVESIIQTEEIFNESRWGPILREGVAALLAESWHSASKLCQQLNRSSLVEEVSDRVFLLMQEGYFLEKVGNPTKAIECYLNAIELKPEDGYAWSSLGLTYYNLKNYQKAVESHLKAIELDPNHDGHWCNMGLSHYHLEDYNVAIECYLKAIELKPDRFETWHNMGLVNYDLKDHQKAIECYLKAIEFKPDDDTTWSNMGNVYGDLDDHQKALECYLKALEFKPDSHHAWSNMGTAYGKLSDYQKALECFLKALEFKPDYHTGWSNMGAAYRDLGDHQKAIECFLKALEFKSDDDTTWYNMGNAYGDLDDHQKALECYLKALEFKPDSHHAWSNMGTAYGKLSDYQKALECFLKALEFKPDYHTGWSNMGAAYRDLGDHQKAIECFLKALEFKSDDDTTWYNMGNAYGDLDDHQKAIECFLKALEFKSDSHHAWSNMGIAHTKLGDHQKAIECFLKALEFKSDSHHAWSNMGIAHTKLGDHQKAIECFLKALELKPDKHEAWYNTGNAYDELGNQQKAIECYLKALEFKPDDDATWYNMGNAYDELGNQQKAIECYLKAIELKPEEDAVFGSLGWAYLILGEIKDARDNLLNAWELSQHKVYQYPMNIGHTFLLSNEKNQAINWYQKSLSLLDKTEEFFKGMEQDYDDLKMEKFDIDRDDYDQILIELKDAQ